MDTILNYCRYNLLATDMDDVLTPFAEKQGIGLINASGLHMGVLTERGAPEWHPAPPEVHAAGRVATEFCRLRGLDVAGVALRFCFDHPTVASTLVGMSTVEEVQKNLQLLSLATDPALLEELRSLMGPVLNRIWPSGRPENRA